MQLTDVATRKGSMAHVHQAVIVDGASLVWSVRARGAGQGRLDGDLGRLEVADLAHEDDVGVLRRKERRADANVRPICSFIWTC
jgi:hypothetical protein